MHAARSRPLRSLDKRSVSPPLPPSTARRAERVDKARDTNDRVMLHYWRGGNWANNNGQTGLKVASKTRRSSDDDSASKQRPVGSRETRQGRAGRRSRRQGYISPASAKWPVSAAAELFEPSGRQSTVSTSTKSQAASTTLPSRRVLAPGAALCRAEKT